MGGCNGEDILMESYEHRNRALEGDIVIVEILPRRQWKIIEKHATNQGS